MVKKKKALPKATAAKKTAPKAKADKTSAFRAVRHLTQGNCAVEENKGEVAEGFKEICIGTYAECVRATGGHCADDVEP